MIKLKRLKIVKYRNVAPGTELLFNDGANVLLGQNGTGKTTLLTLISMLCRQDLSSLRGEAFEIEYELASTSGTLSIFVRNEVGRREAGTGRDQTTHISREAFSIPSSSAESAAWSHRVVANVVDSPAHFTLSSNPMAAYLEDSTKPGARQPVAVESLFESYFISLLVKEAFELVGSDPQALAKDGPKSHLLILMWDLLLLMSNGGRFDESLVTFKAMTGEFSARDLQAPYSSRLRFLALSSDTRYDDKGVWFTPIQGMVNIRDNVLPSNDDDIIIVHEKYDFLARVVTLLRLQSAEMRLERVKKEVTEAGELVDFGNYRFFFTDETGSRFSHDYLSYGQKRLLAFFYYLACNESIVIADELVNGMHHEWIEACLEALGDRQSFLTSQNPLLLDYLSFESAEQATKTFILCSTKIVDGRKQLVWQNMPEADASEFFAAYEVGIQHVSAILRTKGLW